MKTKAGLLSIIICVYNMPREAPRTILSALPPYQKNVNENEYEVIVVDNGSTQPIDRQFINSLPEQVKFVQYPEKAASPVFSLNWAAQNIARGDRLMFCIDGARIFSDGLVAECIKYSSLYPNAFIYTLAWHLGPDLHMNAAKTGYNQTVEDKLLSEMDWMKYPGRLFENSVFAGSSKNGFFLPINESNALVISRETAKHHQLYNEGFTSAGGGLCNLELFERYVTASNITPICLLGEGTFHQIHGGAATSNPGMGAKLREEYQAIMKRPYKKPDYSPLYAGRLRKEARKFYEESIRNINAQN